MGSTPDWTVTRLKRETWRALNAPLPRSVRAKIMSVREAVGFCKFNGDGEHSIVVDSMWTDRGMGRIVLHELIHAAAEDYLSRIFSRDLNEAVVVGWEQVLYDRIMKSPRERVRWGRKIAERLREAAEGGH